MYTNIVTSNLISSNCTLNAHYLLTYIVIFFICCCFDLVTFLAKCVYLFYIKVSKSRKQIMKSWILPKNEWNTFRICTILSVICSFFGRINDIIICFRDLLAFINRTYVLCTITFFESVFCKLYFLLSLHYNVFPGLRFNVFELNLYDTLTCYECKL